MVRVKTRPYKKRGKTGWEVDVTIAFPDGLPPKRVKRKSPCATEKQAYVWGMTLGVNLSQKPRFPRKQVAPVPPPKVITFSELVPIYMKQWVEEKELSAGTEHTYLAQMQRYLIPALGTLSLDAITAERIAELRASLRWKKNGNKRSPNHRNYLMELLQRMLTKAKAWKLLPGEVPEFPEKLTEKKVEIEVFADDELSRLIETAQEHTNTYVMVLLGCDAGLRLGEMAGLRWKDIDLQEGRLVVRQQVTSEGNITPPKGKAARGIPLTPRLKEALKAAQHLNERVLWGKEEALTRWELIGLLLRAERKAKLIAHKSPHKLRHTFASRLLAKGATLKAVQELLGHKSLQTTLMYLHLQKGEVDRAIGLLSGDNPETKEKGIER